MALTLYLAMTAAEMQSCAVFPEHVAWMACHFSPYHNGLSNIPTQLPTGSVLILNDRIPPQGHDPAVVAAQLAQAVGALNVSRVLLDLQRPDNAETAQIAKAITQRLACPVGVTPMYAQALSCAVFLTPRLRIPLPEQLKQWPGREIWLDAALDCEQIEVTKTGSIISPGSIPDAPKVVHTDQPSHCRYCLELEESCARFTVWRDMAQLKNLLSDADDQQIACAIGLYQQLQKTTAEDD